MKKTGTTNTFTGGMVMDLNPQETPDNVLVNALNGTIVTFQGNEKVLQNDMGNGRVETAFLPENYIPLGTAELGGIVYVVSYNPLDNKCQIGSFPSPERNLTSNEDDTQSITTLDNSNFVANNNVTVFYIKNTLGNLTFNPGDKFIVYGDNIGANYEKFYKEELYNSANFDTAAKQTIKLELGTITSSGKLVKFSDLKQYSIPYTDSEGEQHTGGYFISSQPQKDLDTYTTLTSQPYNVFTSKVSGQLVLIAELIQFNSFSATIKHQFGTNEEKIGIYNPLVSFTLEGDYPFIPNGVKVTYTYNDLNESFFDIKFLEKENNLVKELIKSNNKSYYIEGLSFISNEDQKTLYEYIKGSEKSGKILKYSFTPYMNWGELPYLTIKGQIDLDKVGTGEVKLNSWKYYKNENSLNLTWGLDIYEEEGFDVTGVEMHMFRFNNETLEETIYSVNKKASYNGVFYDILPLNKEDYRLSKPLVPNTLYLVKIVATYEKLETHLVENKEFYRWLYTNTVFNSKYYTDTNDYDTLTLPVKAKLSQNFNTTDKLVKKGKGLGILSGPFNSADSASKSSLSEIQTLTKSTVNFQNTIDLENDYNTFHLDCSKAVVNISLGDIACSETATIVSTEEDDIDTKNYLNTNCKSTVDPTEEPVAGNIDNWENTDRGEAIKNAYTYEVYVNKETIAPEKQGNEYTFKINYTSLKIVKAACTKQKESIHYTGKIIPLAYDQETFKYYNMTLSSEGNWEPTFIGAYSLKDEGTYIKKFTKNDELDSDQGENWGTQVIDKGPDWHDENQMVSKQKDEGWTNATIFITQYRNKDNVCIELLSNPSYPDQKDVTQEEQRTFSVPISGEGGAEGRASKYPYKHRMQLTLKATNSDCYLPIDFSTNFDKDREKASSKVNPSEVYTLNKDFFNIFAMVLNNLYRYDNRGFDSDYIFPNSVHYMDKCEYTLNIPITTTISNLSSAPLQLVDSGQALSDLPEAILGKDNESKISTNNITYKIEDKLEDTQPYYQITEDDSSGKTLRDDMLAVSTYNANIAIMDYNGTTIIGNIYNADTSKIYQIVKKDSTVSVENAYGIPFKKLNYKYSNGVLTTTESSENIDKGEININKFFTLDSDGLLVLNEPNYNKYGVTMNCSAGGGTARGYYGIGLLKSYRVYSS